MANGKIVAINYETPEQAESMAAQINASEQGISVRAFSNGRTLEIIPANPVLADLFTFFRKISKSFGAFFGKVAGTSGDSAENNSNVSKGSVSA